MESRSEEATRWRKLQFIVYVMGLFHLKMACADAIWRIFIQPKGSDVDENSRVFGGCTRLFNMLERFYGWICGGSRSQSRSTGQAALRSLQSRHLQKRRGQLDKDRDQQRENNILLGRLFLLYEESSHTMNHGDIGRVEDCFLLWMYIFMGCGKHKYAKEMKRYL